MLSVRSATLCLILLALPAMAGAQVHLVDEGTFTLFENGERTGREDFSIRAAPGPGGSAFIAQGNVLIGNRRLSVALSADSAGFPLRYSLEETQDGKPVEKIAGEASRGVWRGRAVRPADESVREFRIPANAMALEDGVVHQLWFVLQRAGGAPPTLLVPRALTLREVLVQDAGPDSVTIGLRVFAARRWVVRAAADSLKEPLREAWTDLSGRLLRVRIPSARLEALRDEPPVEGRVPGQAAARLRLQGGAPGETPAGAGAYVTPEPFPQDIQ